MCRKEIMAIVTSVFSFTRVHHVFAWRHSDGTDKNPKDYDLRESYLMCLSATVPGSESLGCLGRPGFLHPLHSVQVLQSIFAVNSNKLRFQRSAI